MCYANVQDVQHVEHERQNVYCMLLNLLRPLIHKHTLGHSKANQSASLLQSYLSKPARGTLVHESGTV